MTVGIAAKWPLMYFSAVWFIIPTVLGLDFSRFKASMSAIALPGGFYGESTQHLFYPHYIFLSFIFFVTSSAQ